MPLTKLTTKGRNRINSFSIGLFYLIVIGCGILSIFGDPAPVIVGALGYGIWNFSFGIAYVTAGVGALAVHLLNRSRAESQILLLLSSVVVAHGGILLYDRAYMTGIFVIGVSMLLVNISVTTAGVTFTRSEVLAAIEDA